MWLNILPLALAVNFEPTRIALLPLLLSRERPLLQLVAFVAVNVSASLCFGMIALFALHELPAVQGGALFRFSTYRTDLIG